MVEAVENQASDLVAGEYEGGYKVWECSIDLSKYIAENGEIVRGKKVLELGCGQGLAGITAIMCGGVVHFQDYDVDVVENLTIPIVMRNIERADSTCSNNSRFFAGDWGTLREVLDETYDVVLTSETIYSVENMPRLLGCIKSVRISLHLYFDIVKSSHLCNMCMQCLKKPNGICYVSAKSFYFGVGGGVAAFKKLVDADGDMSHTDIAVIDDGRSNRREIFKLSFAS